MHAICYLVDTQVHRLNFDDLHHVPHATYTLVSQLSFPLRSVKAAVSREAPPHAAHLRQLIPAAVDVEPANVTGHFMRRSQAKHLARLGCDFASIQWTARHSSQTTWIYVEEAMAEAPRSSKRIMDALTINDLISETLSKVNSVEEALQKCRDQVHGEASRNCD